MRYSEEQIGLLSSTEISLQTEINGIKECQVQSSSNEVLSSSVEYHMPTVIAGMKRAQNVLRVIRYSISMNVYIAYSVSR